MEHWFLNLKLYVFSQKRKEITLLEDKDITEPQAPQLYTDISCSQTKMPEPSVPTCAACSAHALWCSLMRAKDQSSFHVICFLSLSACKPLCIVNAWWCSTRPNARRAFWRVDGGLSSKDTWEVLQCRLGELWLWLFHVMQRWLLCTALVHPCLLAGAHGQVLHPESVSSSGLPWGYPGMELSREHMRLALHLLLAPISGSPLEWFLAGSWWSAVLLRKLEVRQKGKTSVCTALPPAECEFCV